MDIPCLLQGNESYPPHRKMVRIALRYRFLLAQHLKSSHDIIYSCSICWQRGGEFLGGMGNEEWRHHFEDHLDSEMHVCVDRKGFQKRQVDCKVRDC
jgi:hypothetical protein